MEWFRSSTEFAKRGTVDREKGAIFGVSVNTVVKLKGTAYILNGHLLSVLQNLVTLKRTV